MKDATNEQIPWWDLRNKTNDTRKTKLKKSNSWSSYWMDDDSYDYFYDKKIDRSKVGLGGGGGGYNRYSRSGGGTFSINLNKAARLGAVRRAVSNFVQILTNTDDIKVIFSTGQNSYTDGKTVVISAEADPAKFDVLVGTALHEAAHCIFSPNLFSSINSIPDWDYDKLTYIETKCGVERRNLVAPDLVAHDRDHWITVSTIINFLEDRRIDWEVFSRCPGYRPYYQSMYDSYWNSTKIAKSLINDEELRIPTISSYIFRLINLTNPATKYTLHHLPSMKRIYELVDVNNINRFSDADGQVKAKDIMKLAGQIYNIILQNSVVELQGKDPQPNGTKSSGDSDTGFPNLDNPSLPSNESASSVDGTGDSSENDDGTTDDNDNTPLSDTEIEKRVAKELGKKSLGKKLPNTDKLMKDNVTLINSSMKKKKVSQKMNTIINTMDDSGTVISSVIIDGNKYAYIRIPKLTDGMIAILAPVIPVGSYHIDKNTEYVQTGRRLGQIIVDRLKIRHDNNETKFTRRNLGKIDRRLLHSLGVDNENVFYSKIIETYKESTIYLTIDASGSMNGDKWGRSVILATGLAYAAKKINNFDIVVNLRYGLDSIWTINLFDSRVDPFSHLERWFPRFVSGGATPESIVYEIEKTFIEGLKTSDNNVYFITLTDGYPTYSVKGQPGYFNGMSAQKHCRKMMSMFKEKKIKILSYFISTHGSSNNEPFKQSYGSDGVNVPINNFSSVSKSVNDFLTTSEVI